MKRVAALLLACGLLFALPGLAYAEGEVDRTVTGGMFKLTTETDFAAGTLEALTIDTSIGDGALLLKDGAATGTFTSDIIGTEAFEYLVASWNADLPLGTSVEIFARAYVDMQKEWSGWSSWGVWKNEIKRASTNDEDPLAYMDVDTLTIKGTSGESASRVQMKAVLNANAAGESPVLRQIAATYKNTLEGQSVTPAYYGEAIELPARVQLDTPAYSQGIRERSIASSMCSATTIAVLLNDRGEDVLPEEIALQCYDSVYDGFGNWSFSVAAAAAHGYEAYCQYADLDVLRQELAHGYSVGLSVKYANADGTSYPYLAGAPIGSTNGHLITITGYETVDSVDYFFSSDSAAGSDPACFLRYRADQLDKAWAGKLAYIVHDKEAGAKPYSPNRIDAALTPLAGETNSYALTVDGTAVAINKNLNATKLRADGGGIVAYYIEDADKAPIPETAQLTTANSVFRYTITTGEDSLRIEPSSVLGGATGEQTLHIFLMLNNGVTYETSLTLDGGPAPTATPTEAPAATEVPAATGAPAAPVSAAAAPAAGNGSAMPLIVAALLVVVIVVIIFARKAKKGK